MFFIFLNLEFPKRSITEYLIDNKLNGLQFTTSPACRLRDQMYFDMDACNRSIYKE